MPDPKLVKKQVDRIFAMQRGDMKEVSRLDKEIVEMHDPFYDVKRRAQMQATPPAKASKPTLKASTPKARAVAPTPPPKAKASTTPATPADWQAACRHIAKRDGCTLAQAGRVAMREYAHLHPIRLRGRQR